MSGSATAIARAQTMRNFLLAAGVPEVSIEVQCGRPASGDEWNALNPVAVISHHIASTPTVERPTPGLALVKRGRSDLPGPLCNGTAGVDLVYRIICLGLANHPGVGGPWTVSGPLGTYTIPRDVARPYVWGTEYEGGYSDAVWDKRYTNRRTGKSMTFREFMGRANLGLTRGIWAINNHGKRATDQMDLSGYHGEHLTWAPGRKFDRMHYTTASGRAEIQRARAATAAPPRTLLQDLTAARGKADRVSSIYVIARNGAGVHTGGFKRNYSAVQDLMRPLLMTGSEATLQDALIKAMRAHHASHAAAIKVLAAEGAEKTKDETRRGAFRQVEGIVKDYK